MFSFFFIDFTDRDTEGDKHSQNASKHWSTCCIPAMFALSWPKLGLETQSTFSLEMYEPNYWTTVADFHGLQQLRPGKRGQK